MKTRISALVCLLCVFGFSDLSRAGDPSSQRGDDPYDAPTMSSGTIEPYLSFMAGIAVPRSEDATFANGIGPGPRVVKDVDYQTKHTLGGNAGIWFPTRDKLWGFDLGIELTGFIWYADVACCQNYYNRDPATGAGTTTEIQGAYVGTNFLVRYPVSISEAYPNGRWFPYVGIGVGAHQMMMRHGGSKGVGWYNAILEQRDTTVALMGVGGVKAHLFKYVAVFAEAKYIHAHHNGLLTDRYGLTASQDNGGFGSSQDLFLNTYSSTIDTIMAHAGVSIHFDIRP